MEISDTSVKRIERYLAGELSPEERVDFEQSYKDDADFAAVVDTYHEARKAIDLFSEEAVKAQFKQRYYAESATKKRPFHFTRTYMMAAVIALLLVSVALLLFLNQPQSPQELYASNFQMENLSWSRGEDNTSAVFEQANRLYNQGEYTDAIPLLQNLLADAAFQRKPYAYLHLGLSYMGLGESDAAITAFKEIPDSSSFGWKAKWYMAMAFLKEERVEEAKAVLQELQASMEFRTRAAEILGDL